MKMDLKDMVMRIYILTSPLLSSLIVPFISLFLLFMLLFTAFFLLSLLQ